MRFRVSYWSPSHASFFTLVNTSRMAFSAVRQPALRIASNRYSTLRGSTFSRAAFSTSPRWQIRTKEMTERHFKDLKVNQKRLMEDLHHTCQWGTGERWGESVTSAFLGFMVLMNPGHLQRLECPVLRYQTPTSRQEIGLWRRRRLWVARLRLMRWATSSPFDQG